MPEQDLGARTEKLTLNCPYCQGENHTFAIEVQYSIVAFLMKEGGNRLPPRTFTRVFRCPTTEKDFEAKVTIQPEDGEVIDEVVVKAGDGTGRSPESADK